MLLRARLRAAMLRFAMLATVSSSACVRSDFLTAGRMKSRPVRRNAFARLTAVLQQGNSDIRIEGHTDNVPFHNARFSSNWVSAARPTATVRLLIQKYGFAPERLGASGYAEYRPAATNGTPEERAMYRRVDVVIPRRRN